MANTSTGAMHTAQEAFEKHKIVLQENLKLWQQVEREHGADPNVKKLVSQGYQDTMSMITICGELESKLFSNLKTSLAKSKSKRQSSEPDSSPTPTKRRKGNGKERNAQNPAAAAQTAPIVDASGLFMIDPNPTEVNTLFSDKQNASAKGPEKKKRRRSAQQDEVEAEPQALTDEPNSRKKRRRAGTTTNPAETSRANVEDASQTHNDPVDEDAEHQQSFEAKVALRLKDKEEQRKKKSTKKRKRSSEVSTVADENENAVDPNSNTDPPKKIRKPRAKKAKESTTDKEEAPLNSSNKKRSRQRSSSKPEE